MEGRTQVSRSMNIDQNVPGNGNPGANGGGTYTGNNTDQMTSVWEDVFGPAGRDVRLDQQRAKRHQRYQLPDVLRGANYYLTDRVDGLVTDATKSPFTSVILPYMYVENPDQKMRWNVWSFDEGLAGRVPYEAAARVLTQSKRSYAAFTVRNGLAIEMEHMFLMSEAGMKNFKDQTQQLVGSIQMSNDLDVHVALIQVRSYAEEYMERYNSVDKTPQQVCREYVNLFGAVQKSPTAMDTIIEDARAQLRLWGSQEPTFLMCNQRVTTQLTMSPDRTSYVTQGSEGTKRLRGGPNLNSYRGLDVVHTRQFELESHAMPRDILRRRVRVAEYYRVPPQQNENWEVELYDESRDTWFRLSKRDLDRFADLSGTGGSDDDNNNMMNENGINHVFASLDEMVGLSPIPAMSTFRLYYDRNGANPTQCVTMPHALRPDDQALSNWSAVATTLGTMHGNAFQATHARTHFKVINEHLSNSNLFYPRPNQTNWTHMTVPFPMNNNDVPFWLFMNSAFLDGVCTFLWKPLRVTNTDMIRERVIPFVYADSGNCNDIKADYERVLALNSRINVYHTPMFLGGPMRWHPDPDVRRMLEAAFSDARISMHALQASLAHFVKRCIDSTGNENVPQNRIQMGRRLDQAFKGKFPRAEDKNAIYDPWPEAGHHVPVAQMTGVSETTGTLDDYAIEQFYNQNAAAYTWNTMDDIHGGNISEYAVRDSVVLDSFFYAAMRRMLASPAEHTMPVPFWPKYVGGAETQGQYEYVIIRPVIEHNMLGVIIGRGGPNDSDQDKGLGAVLWGNTELSCYDDSFHGVWGMSYKYHSRAIVFNNKNLIRLFDVAYDGYNGGKDDRPVNWVDEAPGNYRPFNRAVGDMSVPYNGPSLMVMRFKVDPNGRDFRKYWPSPIVFHDKLDMDVASIAIDPDAIHRDNDPSWRVFNNPEYREQYRPYMQRMPDFSYYHQSRKAPGFASMDNESTQGALAFQGSMRIINGDRVVEITGSGHHGADYVGVAATRSGMGARPITKAPEAMRLVA